MNNPKQVKSHIVPKAYLKGFTHDDIHLWNLKINSKFHKIKEVSTSKICYIPNFYRIPNEEIKESLKVNDVDQIEKDSFTLLENNYCRILNEIANQKLTLTLSDANLLIDMILSIKCRNEKFKNFYSEQNIKPSIEKSLSLFKKQLPAILSQLNIHDFNFELNIDTFIKKNPNFIDSLYYSTMLKIRDNLKEFREILMNNLWLIIYSSDLLPFISSDNPGFSIDKNDNVFDKFGKDTFIFQFPLNSKYALCISNEYNDDLITNFKRIFYKPIQQSLVEKFNLRTIKVCNSHIFANNKDVLKPYIEK